MVQVVEFEPEPRAHLERRGTGRRHRWRLEVDVEFEFEHEAFAAVERRTQSGTRCRRVGEHLRPDPHDLARLPWIRHPLTGCDQEMAAEPIGPCGSGSGATNQRCRRRRASYLRRTVTHLVVGPDGFVVGSDGLVVGSDGLVVGSDGPVVRSDRKVLAATIVPAPTHLRGRRMLASAVRTRNRHSPRP